MRASICACVFDKDGTLLDAEETWRTPFRAACRAMPDDDEHLFSVLGFDSSTGRFSPTQGFMVDTNHTLAANMHSRGIDSKLFFETLAAQPLRNVPLADTASLFNTMREAGLQVGVLTSDDRASAERFLAGEGVAVDAMVCGDDGRGMKPSAEPLLAVATDMGVPIEAIMMVGDSLHDVHCAKSAGALAVAVMSGVADRDALVGPADCTLGSVAEMDAVFLLKWMATT
eukprot:COSAG05_NODE_2169_length_3442_cov_5.100808_2_plen_228_part_00